MFKFIRRRACAAMLVAGAFSGPATAQLLLDGFSAPVGGWTRTATGARGTDSATVRVCEAGLPVPGGARDVVHAIFINPLNSVSAVAVGHGRLSLVPRFARTAT